MLKDRQNDFLGTGGVPAWHVLAHTTLVSDICKRQSDPSEEKAACPKNQPRLRQEHRKIQETQRNLG